MTNPRDTHLQTANVVLKYLKMHWVKDYFISLHCKQPSQHSSCWLVCLCGIERYVTWDCMFLDDSLISWRSKKQPIVSRNSSEAEYISTVDGICELIWIRSLFSYLHCAPPGLATLYYENRYALLIASSHVYHERTKYIENDCHLVEEQW